MKKVIGWILIVWGVAGWISNVVFIAAHGWAPFTMVGSTLVAGLFVLIGYRWVNTPGAKPSP